MCFGSSFGSAWHRRRRRSRFHVAGIAIGEAEQIVGIGALGAGLDDQRQLGDGRRPLLAVDIGPGLRQRRRRDGSSASWALPWRRAAGACVIVLPPPPPPPVSSPPVSKASAGVASIASASKAALHRAARCSMVMIAFSWCRNCPAFKRSNTPANRRLFHHGGASERIERIVGRQHERSWRRPPRLRGASAAAPRSDGCTSNT